MQDALKADLAFANDMLKPDPTLREHPPNWHDLWGRQGRETLTDGALAACTPLQYQT